MLEPSQSRHLPVLALAWFAILEPASWLTSRIPPCVVDAAIYGAYYSENKECPAFHVFLVKLTASVLEKLGDPAWATFAATIAIAAFTGTLWWSTRGMLRATSESINLARDQLVLARNEFLATNRPRLRIRFVRRVDATPADPIAVGFAVVNVGNSAAHLLGSNITIDFFADPPPIAYTGIDVTTPRRFLPGASDDYTAVSTRKGLIIQTEFTKGRSLYVYGYVVYADELETARTTAFCRRWDQKGSRFCQVDDPDYEYED